MLKVKTWKVIVFLVAIFAIVILAVFSKQTQMQKERNEAKTDIVAWIDSCPAGSHLTKDFHYTMSASGESTSALLKCTNWKDEQPMVEASWEYACNDNTWHERYLDARECELDSGHSYVYCFAVANMKRCKKK